MAMWGPWRGCRRYSEGCRFCYIHKGDAKRGIDTNDIVRTDNFDLPVQRKKNGEYKIRPGDTVYTCFSADFLIEEADEWRAECWAMIRQRSDLNFLFLTKRIVRFNDCIPDDWGNGYDNVTVGCTIEDQETADERLTVFDELPIKHKNIIAQPMIGKIDLEGHLKGVELVVAGGEQDKDARPMMFDWVLDMKEQCRRHSIPFQFRQTGTNFIMDGKRSRMSVRELKLETDERSQMPY